jgi:hypothetical protein
MSKISNLTRSRKEWKKKAIKRGEEARYNKKEVSRLKRERNRYKKKVRELKNKVKQGKRDDNLKNIDKESVVHMSLQLFLIASISFRAVPRVIEVLKDFLGIKKAPSVQTVINWVTRLSLVRIRDSANLICSASNNDRFSNGFFWLIDITIALGKGKILTVLALDSNYHKTNKGPPALCDLHCIAVAVSDSWTGESVANFLQKVISVVGRPSGYLKDGGKDLEKAVRLLGEREIGSCSIDDISHVIANLLKHEYENDHLFDMFISSCGKVSRKLKQTVLACLAPPKTSQKTRFMNVHILVKWADNLLKQSPKGCAKKGSILEKLRGSLEELPECKTFIKRFLRDAQPLLESQKILKYEGLTQTSYEKCQKLIQDIPQSSSVRRGFETWAEEQLLVAEALGLDNIGLPISSDGIESLFGRAKQHGTGAIKDANRIALRMPSLCGPLRKEHAKEVLKITVKEQQEVESVLSSLTKQRRQIFKEPNSLGVLKGDIGQGLELIPGEKRWSKKQIDDGRTDSYKENDKPLFPPDREALPMQKVAFA